MSIPSCNAELVNFWPLSRSSSKVYEPAQNASVLFHVNVNWFPLFLNTSPAVCATPLVTSGIRPCVTVAQLLVDTGPLATSVFAAKLVTGFAGCAFAQPVPGLM